MNCIINAFDLFKTNTCQATTLVVIALVVGMIAMCLLCKLFCPCGKNRKQDNAKSPKKSAAQEEKPFEKRKPHPAPADGSVEIYVGNLSYDMTEDQLRKEFEAFGTVNSARIITNRYTGKSKGFGFVHMPNRAEVDAALKVLSDKEILGRKLKCNEAKNVG